MCLQNGLVTGTSVKCRLGLPEMHEYERAVVLFVKVAATAVIYSGATTALAMKEAIVSRVTASDGQYCVPEQPSVTFCVPM